MERKNKEKSKSCESVTNFNITTKHVKNQNEGIPLQLKSDKLAHLKDFNFEKKFQKLFDSKKFSIGNQFDQKGCEKFLSEKDECLKCMDLDYTILDKKKSKKCKKKTEKKMKIEKKNINNDLKYISEIEINKLDTESFFSTESSRRIIEEFVSN